MDLFIPILAAIQIVALLVQLYLIMRTPSREEMLVEFLKNTKSVRAFMVAFRSNGMCITFTNVHEDEAQNLISALRTVLENTYPNTRVKW